MTLPLVDKHGCSFAGLIQHQAPTATMRERLDPPVPARCTALAYDGTVVTVDGDVTARAARWVAFEAEYDGWGRWIAFVDRRCCRQLLPDSSKHVTP